MTDPIQDRMDALTQANVRLLRRVDELERRLEELEGRHKVVEPEAPQPQPNDAVRPPAEIIEPPPPERPLAGTPVVEAHVAALRAEPTPEAAPRLEHAPSLESRLGLNWISRIGAVTLVIGAAFFFKYAIDNEWIGPTGRILLGLLAGTALCAFGFRSWRRDQSVFAQGVTAAGTSVLYLSFWAAHWLYGLIPSVLAFALMVGTTALGGGFAMLFGAEALGLLGYYGGLATPFLLSKGEYHPWILTLYLFALNAGWVSFARSLRWRWTEGAAAAGTVLTYAAFHETLQPAEHGPVPAAWGVLQYAVFALSRHAWMRAAAQLLAGICVAVSWGGDAAPALAVCWLLLAAGLALAEFRSWPPLPAVALLAFALGYSMLREGAASPPAVGAFFAGATAAFAVVFGYTALVTVREQKPSSYSLVLLIAPGALYFLAGFEILHYGYESWRGLFTAALAALHLGMAWRQHSLANRQAAYDARGVLFSAGLAITLATIALAVQFNGFRITMVWAIEAAALAWLATRYGQARLRWAVLALTALVLVRLMAFDALAYINDETLQVLWNTRMLTHVVSAAALGASAWWLRDSEEAVVPYIAAHVALLHGLAWENYTWVLSTTPPAGRASAISTGLTMLGAVYGLALVVSGVWRRFPFNRLLGLGLLALVVGKLYVIDVWSMERLHRIAAFSVLGLLLLATSFLYSRFRAKIEDWMRNDQAETR